MKKSVLNRVIIFSAITVLIAFGGCSEHWDIYEMGIPKFVSTNFIELDKICCISKFRSSEGHDYSDSFEHCSSMKHYFKPSDEVTWSTVKIYSPVAGTIRKVDEEWAGTQIHIESDDYPAFRFIIFHINLSKDYKNGDRVEEGELLGTHIGDQTMSDIAVEVSVSFTKRRLVSFFDVMTDDLFVEFFDRGISSRETLIITESERKADPLSCDGETFTSAGSIGNWVYLY